MNAKQLRELIIRPALEELGFWSETAENLLMGTAAQESHLGEYIAQINGPALGIFQMEPATHDDIWLNYIAYRNELRDKMGVSDTERLIYDLKYAAKMARIHYLRRPDPLPENNPEELGKYWKVHYNTHLGKGTVAEFIHNYQRLVK